MSFASIMVAVDDGLHAPARVRLAAEVAHRFGARLVGVSACLPEYPSSYGETAVPVDMVIQEIRQAARDKLANAEQVFRTASCLKDSVEWRSDIAYPVRFLEQQAWAADLIVVSQSAGEEATPNMKVDLGDALMRLGRPVLVVPPGVEHLEARRIILGWKNTLQARRAMSDAMPFLKRAEAVQVLRVTADEDRSEIKDVIGYLARHDVNASALRSKPSGSTVADDLQTAAGSFGADLIVTGAYGYSRLQEWLFGGVTRDLLTRASLCCLMSH